MKEQQTKENEQTVLVPVKLTSAYLLLVINPSTPPNHSFSSSTTVSMAEILDRPEQYRSVSQSLETQQQKDTESRRVSMRMYGLLLRY